MGNFFKQCAAAMVWYVVLTTVHSKPLASALDKRAVNCQDVCEKEAADCQNNSQAILSAYGQECGKIPCDYANGGCTNAQEQACEESLQAFTQGFNCQLVYDTCSSKCKIANEAHCVVQCVKVEEKARNTAQLVCETMKQFLAYSCPFLQNLKGKVAEITCRAAVQKAADLCLAAATAHTSYEACEHLCKNGYLTRRSLIEDQEAIMDHELVKRENITPCTRIISYAISGTNLSLAVASPKLGQFNSYLKNLKRNCSGSWDIDQVDMSGTYLQQNQSTAEIESN